MRHPPFARGVTTLMYVGDVPTTTSTGDLIAGAGAAYVAYKSRGLVRLAAAGIAAWMGYRVYKSR